MYKAIARMFDGDKQWNVTIVTSNSLSDAERAAYRFFNLYSNTALLQWIQIKEA